MGALIIDPQTNVVISEGHNGTPRGSDKRYCGGEHLCEREEMAIPTELETMSDATTQK